jgi:hypothetical protein
MTEKDATSVARHAWLETATSDLRSHFIACGYTVPMNVRVSIGWPKGSRGGHKAGQCWAATVCTDGHFEIFVSPSLRDSLDIFATLAHELVHATVGLQAGHKKPFKQCAVSIGLEGKMTATTAGEKMRSRATAFIAATGEYPAGAITAPTAERKQSTRMLKCECAECGYTVRTTRQWIDNSGAPLCPCNSEPMTEVSK